MKYAVEDLYSDITAAFEALGEMPTDEERTFVISRVRFGVRGTSEEDRAEQLTTETIRDTVEVLLASYRSKRKAESA